MNKRKPSTTVNRLIPEDKALEFELINMLRSTGRMFPYTPDQIAAFRQLNLNDEVPDDCKDPLGLLNRETKEE